MRMILSTIVVLGFVGFSSAQEAKIDAAKLIGKWEPAKSKDGGPKTVIEFADKGKLTLEVTVGEKTQKVEGTYKLEGAKMELALKIGDMEMKETFTILKLTDDEMTSKDSKGKEETLKKIKAK